MIEIEFSEADKEKLHYERFHHPHPWVAVKMEVIWLKSQGESHQRIAELACVHVNTVTAYLKEYAEGGIEKVKEVRFHGSESKLEAHKQSLEAEFKKSPPISIVEAGARIAQITGIKRSNTQVGIFLKKMGLKRRKVGILPAKADPDEQEVYKAEKLMPRLAEAELGTRAVFFVDSAHFVWSAFLGYVWCFVRVFIKSPPGRKRFNVLGALNAVTHEFISVTNETYITATSVCELLGKLANLNLKIPITIVLDNARYQHCQVVEAFAALVNIELLFLPTYSPNLNLIERLWKFVKQQTLYSKYYPTFDSFKTAINQCLAATHTLHKHKLDSLLTLHFQTLPKSLTDQQLFLFPSPIPKSKPKSVDNLNLNLNSNSIAA